METIRALRVADALRQRGTTLKTSAGYQILVDQNTANAILAFQKGSGETFLLETAEAISSGEANLASGELTPGGDLRISFSRGSFKDRETARKGAFNVAVIIDDIQRDIVETFQRPAGGQELIKSNEDIRILVEEADDNLEFGELVLERLKEISADLAHRSRIVPSLKKVAPGERERYNLAAELDWPRERRMKALVRMAQAGHQIDQVDPDRAFTDVRVSALREGDMLITAGAPPGFVYVPLTAGLVSAPLGGYQSFEVQPWIPLGNTRVIRGAPQEATVTAQGEVTVLMIPKEIYLKHWHDTYTIEEFKEFIPRVYAEARVKGFEQMLAILKQVAMIDAHLDDAEVAFLQRFAETWDMPFDAGALRAELEHGGKTDYTRLRQSVADYLSLAPPFSQVAQLRDLLGMFVKADASVSAEEGLILSELTGLFASYLEEEQGVSQHLVLIVLQDGDQDLAIGTLFPAFPKRQISGGQAYLAGTYYSAEYAAMIAERYRTLNFFSTVEEKAIQSQGGEPHEDPARP